MASWDDVRRIALGLPETTEKQSRGRATWLVRDKAFAWERPLRRADLQALGDDVPTGEVLGVSVEHAGAKEALLADETGCFFATPRSMGYPAILVELDRVQLEDLEEVLVEGWLAQASSRLIADYLADK